MVVQKLFTASFSIGCLSVSAWINSPSSWSRYFASIPEYILFGLENDGHIFKLLSTFRCDDFNLTLHIYLGAKRCVKSVFKFGVGL